MNFISANPYVIWYFQQFVVENPECFGRLCGQRNNNGRLNMHDVVIVDLYLQTTASLYKTDTFDRFPQSRDTPVYIVVSLHKIS